MSVEQAKAFIDKLDSDKTFLNQVAGAGSDEARLELAKAAGFEFTAEELAGVIDESGSDELSEDELEAVAGGGGIIYGKENFSSNFKKLSFVYQKVEWT